MTVWFVGRHSGAIEWSARQGLHIDRCAAHLEPDKLQPGDTVIGTLPMHLAARACRLGVRYLHLSFDVPAELRGTELNADQLERFGARLEEFIITPPPAKPTPTP